MGSADALTATSADALTATFTVVHTATATGYVCHGRPEASTTYCQMWASDSVCYSGSCTTPLNCSPDARHAFEANESERLIYANSWNDDRANNERWNSQR